MNEIDTISYSGGRLAIGRSNINDIVLDDVNVSRFHAEIVQTGDLVELRDLESRCGTRLNGRPAKRAVVRDGDVLGIGPFRIPFDGSGFHPTNQRGALRLEAREVTVFADGRPILDQVSLTADPGELVGIIGESGSGKSTLLRALAGVSRPSSGSVTLSGEPVTARLTDVGYVPQDEIVHPGLTVREALTYAARLRLPRDVERPELEATIERVLVELSLDEHASKRIGLLSGGQRKRAGVASELLNRPSLLCLDEPTTGLDPGLEAQMMRLFRELAYPGERAVVVVTHATRSLDLCDKLAVFGRGGALAFYGSPGEARDFFGAGTYDEIYDRLLVGGADHWRTKFDATRLAGPERQSTDGRPDASPEPGPAGSPRAKQRFGRQTAVLAGRYLRVFARDRRNLVILFGQVPLIALAIAFLFEPGLFERFTGPASRGDPRYGIQLLFVLATTAIWFGAITAAREIVKERAVIMREAAVGVRWGAYLMSKGIVLGGVVALQTIFLTYCVLAIRPLDEQGSTYLVVAALLVLTSFVAIALGLLVSATVSSQEQATSFIPLTLIPQLLFAGALVPIEKMAEPIASLSNLVTTRWSLAGIGNSVEMNERIADNPALSRANDYGSDFFSIQPTKAAAILLIFLAVFSIATLLMLVRTGPKGVRIAG